MSMYSSATGTNNDNNKYFSIRLWCALYQFNNAWLYWVNTILRGKDIWTIQSRRVWSRKITSHMIENDGNRIRENIITRLMYFFTKRWLTCAALCMSSLDMSEEARGSFCMASITFSTHSSCSSLSSGSSNSHKYLAASLDSQYKYYI